MHTSVVWPGRKRRSCATIASCQAVSLACSDAASAVPLLEPTIEYGFTSDHPFWRTHAPLPIELLLCLAALALTPPTARRLPTVEPKVGGHAPPPLTI